MRGSDHVVEKLQAQGERLTMQRRLVIEALCTADAHITIHDLHEYLRQTYPKQDLPIPTIYRILQWLKDLGVISQTDMGASGIVYELVDNPPHHHLICLSCGAVANLKDDVFKDLSEVLRHDYGFEPRIDHMAIYGYCQNCRSRRS
jgi:Fur family ferric uptake transcriptional regulator